MWGPQARKVVKGRPLEKGKGKPLEKGKEEEKGKGKPLGKGKEEEKGKGKPLGKGKEEEEEEEEEEGEYVWKPFLGKYRWVKPDHNRMYRRAGTGTTSWKRRAGRVDKPSPLEKGSSSSSKPQRPGPSSSPRAPPTSPP